MTDSEVVGPAHAAAAPRGLVVAALRDAAPRALASVIRRVGDFDDAEDALQEAMLAASQQWVRDGIPDSPVAWLTTVAGRRAVDAVRGEVARRERERRVRELEPSRPEVVNEDDSLTLLLLCCHPSLSRTSQMALTLRAVGGLSNLEIARGLLMSEAAVSQRISRAKASLRESGARFTPPPPRELDERMRRVLDVLGVIHTESHSATEGDDILRPELAAEALRLAREVLARTPSDAPWRGEAMGLVALMLLTNARLPARRSADGTLVPLAEQDRSLWREELIAEGDALLKTALASAALGPYQLKAAIAGVHDGAASYDDTDWRELLGLYDLLRIVAPSPLVELARLIPYAEVHGPDAAMRALVPLESLASPLRVTAVRAHLLERAGRDASADYRRAAELARNRAERAWFLGRAGR